MKVSTEESLHASRIEPTASIGSVVTSAADVYQEDTSMFPHPQEREVVSQSRSAGAVSSLERLVQTAYAFEDAVWKGGALAPDVVIRQEE